MALIERGDCDPAGTVRNGKEIYFKTTDATEYDWFEWLPLELTLSDRHLSMNLALGDFEGQLGIVSDRSNVEVALPELRTALTAAFDILTKTPRY